MRVEVWEEGFRVTGQSAKSKLAWSGEAKDFEDACQKLIAERTNEEGWGAVTHMHKFQNGRHSWWGCGWFPTQEAASYFD